MEIILPSNIDTKHHITTLGINKAERLFLILNYIYILGQWKIDIPDAWITVHSDKLRILGGDHIPRKCTRHIERGGLDNKESKLYIQLIEYSNIAILEIDHSYKPEKYSMSYRFKNRDETFKKQQCYTLLTKPAQLAIPKLKVYNHRKFIEKSPAHAYIYQCVNETTLDMEAAQRERPDYQRYDHFNTDRNGRIYDYIVCMPSELRKYLSWHGEPLLPVDVSACHPTLMGALYDEFALLFKRLDWLREKSRWTRLCSNGGLYDYINSRLAKPFDLSDEDQKGEFKESVFNYIFYGHPNSRAVKKSDVAKTFAECFPFLWFILCGLKRKDHRPFSNDMMKRENDLMINGVVTKLLGKNIPLITVHDCIMTTAAGVPLVQDAIKEEFLSRYGIEAYVKCA